MDGTEDISESGWRCSATLDLILDGVRVTGPTGAQKPQLG